MWVCGGIDSNGVVIAHAYWDGDDVDSVGTHTLEEKACGATWRWNPNDKYLMDDMIPQPRKLTKDEIFKIEDWLFKHGYLKGDEELGDAANIRFQAARKK